MGTHLINCGDNVVVLFSLSPSTPPPAALLSLPPVAVVEVAPLTVWRSLTVSAVDGWPEDDTPSSAPTGVGVVDEDPLRTAVEM